jgi:hypothetical protein
MNEFYTYAYLREDRTPYYIGKGKGDRIYSTRRKLKPPKEKSRIIFLKQNLTEEEAFKHEIYMIAVFGRKDLETGILRNLTDGGEGSSNQGTPEQRSEIMRKANASRTPEQRRESTRIARESYFAKSTPEQRSEVSRKANEILTPEQRSERSRKGKASMTPEQRSEASRKGRLNLTPEQRSDIARRGQASRTLEQRREATRIAREISSKMTPEQRSERSRKGQASRTPEQRSESARKANATKFQCTETGHITNAGALSKYQKARGIDTSKRKKLSE